MTRPSKACSLTVEFLLIQEGILLQHEEMTQIYVIQSEQNPFIWLGVLFIDRGIYLGSVVRFTIVIDESYPDCSCPRVVLSPIPYHPLINKETGELDTSKAFSRWNSTSRKLKDLVAYIKKVIRQTDIYLKQIQTVIDQTNPEINEESSKLGVAYPSDLKPEIASKPDAGLDRDLSKLFKWPDHTLECVRMYHEDPEQFQKIVDDFKQKALDDLYEKPDIFGEDENSLLFTPWVPELHEPLRSCILAGKFAPSNLFATYHKKTDSVTFIPGSEKP